MFDLQDLLCSPHRPDAGNIELRLVYVLKDNTLVVLDKFGDGILTLNLDKLEGEEFKSITKILQAFATTKQEEGLAREKKAEEYRRGAEAKKDTPVMGA